MALFCARALWRAVRGRPKGLPGRGHYSDHLTETCYSRRLTKIGPACEQSESCRHVWLSGVAGSAAVDELGKVGQAVTHQAANFGEGEVVSPGGAPNRKRAWLHPKSCGRLLIVNLVWWSGGVVAEGYCYFNFDCFDICGDGHLESPMLIDVLGP